MEADGERKKTRTAEADGDDGARPRNGEWTVRAHQYEDPELGPTITWADGVRVVGSDGEPVAEYATDRDVGMEEQLD